MAVFVAQVGSGVTAWLPRSQIEMEEGSSVGDGGFLPGATFRITLPAWLALEKGFKAAADPNQKTLF